ncbi:hypothetical protein K443DRAFT_215928 [Laccaria amethystina LaAM-08-1]|uniref:F-box domain-containing protein n=1 Tax=Laccaria amethystina LaAM-08-1 TaxID=1095629 RepID=A0A0C9YGE4_9AGAR|nr:hypothetical protein K443DRAFT_215928 [Laccaria amethystina LaAM-08-1]
MTMGLSPIHLSRIRCYFKVQQPQKQAEIVDFKSRIESLPQHLILEVGRQSHFLRDVLNLSLCSSRLRSALASILYSTIELRSNRLCKAALTGLTRHPGIPQHIKKLVVRPNSAEWTLPGDDIDESLVSNLLASVVPLCRRLEEFVWDGWEMPDDRLWLVLRTSCPSLKSVSTTVGVQPLSPSSHFFEFSDLRQLSLTVKCRSLEWLLDGRPKTEKLPKKFWEMLLERCPNLEELTIASIAPSPRMFDIRHVTAGRWRRLRSLTLGDLVVNPNEAEKCRLPDQHPLMKFFAAHRKLQHVTLQQAGRSESFPPCFSLVPAALPDLESFSGSLRYVKTLPHPERLKHLNLTSLHHTPSVFTPTFSMLRGLPSLISLSIWIDISFGGRTNYFQDESHIFSSLLASSPNLRHLEVLCFTHPTFRVREFSRALQNSPKLESFVLTKMYKPREEDMTMIAARVVHENPNLKKFTLRYTADRWPTQAAGRLRQLGIYEVRCDEHGNPSGLFAYEWGLRAFGFEQSRTFVHPLSTDKTPPSPGSTETKSIRSSFSSGRSAGRASFSSEKSRTSFDLGFNLYGLV